MQNIGGEKLKAYIDKNRCIFCGICGGVCSEVFRVSAEKKSIALDIELTEVLLKKAILAEALCPARAIKITDREEYKT